MLLKKNFIIILVLLVFNTVGFTQDQDASKNLLKRVNGIVDLDFTQDEITGPIYLRYNDFLDSEKPKVVIRLCTNEPIHLALVKSALYFPGIIENFASIGYAGENLIVLKSKDCVSKYESVVTAEVWIIFPNDELPSYDEKYISNQIDVSVLSRSITKYTGSSNYIQNTYKLIEELKKDKSAVGVVLGVYRKNPKDINKKFSRINKLLKNSDLDNLRYIFRDFRWRQELSLDPLEKGHIYPAFFVVKIHKL